MYKGLLQFVIMFFIIHYAYTQISEYNDVVLLKNSSKIYGKIIDKSTEGVVKLETQSGSVFTFGQDEIQQIIKGKSDRKISTDSLPGIKKLSIPTEEEKIQQFKPVQRSTIIKNAYPQYLPPIDENPIITEIGVGLGLPYGFLGGRISMGNDIFSGDVGLGLVPISWDGSFSIGGTIHLLNRYSNVRPKITILWSNTAGYNLIYGKTSSHSTSLFNLKVLYKEAFPGFGFYGGVDIKFGKTSNIFMDIIIGAISTDAGLDKQKERFNEETEELENHGWSLDSKVAPTYFPKFSIGIGYVIGRSLELRY